MNEDSAIAEKFLESYTKLLETHRDPFISDIWCYLQPRLMRLQNCSTNCGKAVALIMIHCQSPSMNV